MLTSFCKTLFIASCLLFSMAALAGGDTVTTVRPNQIFQVDVKDACKLLSKEQLQTVELRINGILSTMRPIDCDPGATPNKLSYLLSEPDNAAGHLQREMLFGSPWRDMKSNFMRDLPYSVGISPGLGEEVLGRGTLRLQTLSAAYIVFGFAFILAVGYGLLRFGRESGLLRDSHSLAAKQRSFSLARVQMAWWFFIVLISYVWLWIVGEGMPSLSTQALGLMGIGSGTYLAAAGVDASKAIPLGESEGFFKDLLSDAKGLALYRFQLLVFNLLFGFLFLAHVVQHVGMPEFDGNILTLLGMSAGTYAGFKIPEQQMAVNHDDPKQGYGAQS